MMHDYGRDVRIARYAREWSRDRLAEETGLTVTQINDIEDGDADPTPALAALQLTHMEMLTTQSLANFSRLVHPMLMKLTEDQLGVVLASVLDVIARAAAGISVRPQVGQLILTGDVIAPDIDQKLS